MRQFYFFQDPSPRLVKRLCYWGPEIRNGRLCHGFSTNSETHPEGTHEYLVDAVTLETWCRCDWCRGKRLSRAGLEKYGPLKLLKPVSLCWHLNAIARWCKHHKAQMKLTRATAIEVNRLLAEQAREESAA